MVIITLIQRQRFHNQFTCKNQKQPLLRPVKNNLAVRMISIMNKELYILSKADGFAFPLPSYSSKGVQQINFAPWSRSRNWRKNIPFTVDLSLPASIELTQYFQAKGGNLQSQLISAALSFSCRYGMLYGKSLMAKWPVIRTLQSGSAVQMHPVQLGRLAAQTPYRSLYPATGC